MSDDLEFILFERLQEVKGTYRDLVNLLLEDNADPRLKVLAEQIYEELTSKLTLGQKHGVRSTGRKMCNGPLCRRAERAYQREKYERAQMRKGLPVKQYSATRAYDDILETFKEIHHDRLHIDVEASIILSGTRVQQGLEVSA